MIEVIDIRKNFGQQEVLRGTRLTIDDGCITTIIGGSGSGKTVLLKTMIALLLPDSGQVLVDGADITRLGEGPLNEMRRKFGFLFQGAALLDSMTIFDNVAFPLRERTRLGEDAIGRKVQERLDQVGLKDMGYKYPAEVSGGMKKRAGFARALVTDPEIVLFDEPTTGLDPGLGRSIHRLIAGMQRRLGFTGRHRQPRHPGSLYNIPPHRYVGRRGHRRQRPHRGVPPIAESGGPDVPARRRRGSGPDGPRAMRHRATEIVVGLFVVAGLLCLGYLAIRLGKLEVFGNTGYVLYADFANVAGVRRGDSVEIAGVNIGRVDSLALADDRARLRLRIDAGVVIQEDAIASVRARGLIGDKFIAISPGASDRNVPPGGRIRDTESPPDITDLIGTLIGGKVDGDSP